MKAVFHHSNDDPSLHTRVLNNVTNLLEDETLDIEAVVLVANSGGSRLLTADSPQKARVESLRKRGVVFKQCRNTLAGLDISEESLLAGVETVPSGVGELLRLQAEGYGYLKP